MSKPQPKATGAPAAVSTTASGAASAAATAMNGRATLGGLTAVRTNSLPGIGRAGSAPLGKSTLTRAASTEELGTAGQVATFKPPVGIDRMERASKRAALAPGVRRWFRFDKAGHSSMITADKHAIAHQTGVQLRDLRLLDPQLSTSYPSAILARDEALVLNLEFIKALVTREYVLVLNAEEEAVIGFIEELQKRLAPKSSSARMTTLAASMSLPDLHQAPSACDNMDNTGRTDSQELGFEATEAPFELRALEIALDVVCGHLERQSVDLEAAAHPALDALTRKVTTHNLERVRRIKSRMVRLKTRGETIKEVLEKYLDDDDDMKDMNLTAKAEDAMQRTASLQRRSLDFSGGYSRDGGDNSPAAAMARASVSGGLQPLTPRNARQTDGYDSDSDDGDVNEVEMLLEAYFMQVDNTCNKLQTLHEYIDDTEDYLNIELDSHRNQLIQLELLLTAGMFAMALITLIAGLFGMNLNNTHEDSYSAFVIVSVVSCVGSLLIFIGIILYFRRKKLLCY